jgi:heme exporter protein D
VNSLDNVVFQALTVVLTLSGLVASGLLWRARGAASGLRMLGIALLPVAAYLTGTLRLIWEIGDAVASWAIRFAFSPLVWLGIAVAGVSVLLFVVSSAMRRRGRGVHGNAAEQRRRTADPSLPAGSSRPPATAPGSEDLDDIEAILRKHGIS